MGGVKEAKEGNTSRRLLPSPLDSQKAHLVVLFLPTVSKLHVVTRVSPGSRSWEL